MVSRGKGTYFDRRLLCSRRPPWSQQVNGVGVALGVGSAVGNGVSVVVGATGRRVGAGVEDGCISTPVSPRRAAAPALWTMGFATGLQAERLPLASRIKITIQTSFLGVTIHLQSGREIKASSKHPDIVTQKYTSFENTSSVTSFIENRGS